MSQDGMFVKVLIDMKSYYDFMFSSAVCSSFKGFNCVIQKLEDPEKLLEICQTQKSSGKFVKTQKHS